MKGFYLIGTQRSGKTAVALGLALKFKEAGLKVSYIKPVGMPGTPYSEGDEDAILMKSVLGLKQDISTIVPVSAGFSYLSIFDVNEKKVERVMNAFRKMQEDSDLILVDGSITPYATACLGTDDFSLAVHMKIPVILIARIESDFSLDQSLVFYRQLKDSEVEIAGCILNNVSRSILGKAEGLYKSLLEEEGCCVLGIIPEISEISSPTVAEYLEVLGGELLTGEKNLHKIVEEVLIGAMTTESALRYLRRATNKAVITGGDRSDIALVALETSISVLILTGGLYPEVRVLAKAVEKGVPVILVHYDTYTAMERLHEIGHHIRAEDEKAVELSKKIVENYCSLEKLFDK